MKTSFVNAVLGMLVVLATSGCANNWHKDWATYLGGNTEADPMINDMVLLENQDVFFTGYEEKKRIQQHECNGVYGVTDLAGKVKWYKQCVDCPADIKFHYVVPTPDSFLLLGVEEKSRTDTTAWIVKVNREGLVEWSKGFGGKDLNTIDDGVVSPSGDYVFVGTFHKKFKDETSDAKLLVLRQNGDVVVEKNLNKQALNSASSIVLTNEGNFIVSLNTSKQFQTYLGLGDDYFSFLLGLDQSGKVLWERKLEEKYTYLADLAPCQDGGAIVLGGIIAHHFTPYSVFVKKITNQGEDSQGFHDVSYHNDLLKNNQYYARTISPVNGSCSYLMTAYAMNVQAMPPAPGRGFIMDVQTTHSYLVARISDSGEVLDDGLFMSKDVQDVLPIDERDFLISSRSNIERYSPKPKK